MRLSIKNIVTKNWPVIGLFLVAIFLRFYRIEDFLTFLGDQGRDAIIIKRIVTLEHFPAIGAPSSVGGIFLGPFYYYLVAPFLPLFHFNPVGLGVGVAFYTLFGMLTSYFVIKKEINLSVALLFLFFLTFSYTLIDFSRFSWNPNLVPLFAFFTIYFLYQSQRRKSHWFPFLFGTFLSLTIQLHYLALALIPPSIFVIGWQFFKKPLKKETLLKILFMGIGFCIFSSPLLIFDLKHNFINTKSFLGLFTTNKLVGQTTPFFDRILETNRLFYQYALQINISQIIGVLLTVALIAWWIYFKKTQKKIHPFIQINFLFFLGYLFIFSLLNSWRYPHYFGSAYASFFLVLAYLINLIPFSSFKKAVIGIITILFLLVNVPHYYFFFIEPNKQIQIAERIANSFNGKISSNVFQIVAIPSTATDGHIRYFLEINGHRPLPYESAIEPPELFILCYTECTPLNEGQWQVAAFHNKKVAKEWKVENVTIYKLIHGL